MENSFKSIIDQSNSILILLAGKPDFDQVAAGLSLYLELKNSKTVSISCPDAMTVEFNRLVGVNRISQDLGNKNLLIRFVDYKADDIEKVSYDIEDREFRLTVVPKASIPAPSTDQVELSHSGISCDTIILVGGLSDTNFPALSSKELTQAKIVHLGNKALNLTSNIQVLSFARPASSISEVVAGLLRESGLTVDSDVATNLLMGIEAGSNKYSDETVNADTFAIVSELIRAGGKRQMPAPIQKDYPLGSIPGQMPQAQAYMKPDYQTLQDKTAVSGIPTISQQMATPPATQSQQKLEKTGDYQDQKNDQEEIPEDWLKQPRVYKGGYQSAPSKGGYSPDPSKGTSIS